MMMSPLLALIALFSSIRSLMMSLSHSAKTANRFLNILPFGVLVSILSFRKMSLTPWLSSRS